eukprot:GHVU01113121.1.p1 GENE.GHVU01113121.1~~GHVU01113121.1.p1  ORF type:complete len:162 (+),score=9.46 GHVU01113121.1:55-540(+)
MYAYMYVCMGMYVCVTVCTYACEHVLIYMYVFMCVHEYVLADDTFITESSMMMMTHVLPLRLGLLWRPSKRPTLVFAVAPTLAWVFRGGGGGGSVSSTYLPAYLPACLPAVVCEAEAIPSLTVPWLLLLQQICAVPVLFRNLFCSSSSSCRSSRTAYLEHW